MRHAQVIKTLRLKAEWLDRKIAETLPGTAKWNALRAERVACETAARELAGRSLQRDVAKVLRRNLDRYEASGPTEEEERRFLLAWCDAVRDAEQAARDALDAGEPSTP